MFNQEEFDTLYPLALDWAQRQELMVLGIGIPLAPRQLTKARLAGVQQPERVRIVAVDKVPLPEDAGLRAASLRTNIVTHACRGISFGYGIILRVDAWGDQELLAHLLVHISQYERAGSLPEFMKLYFDERLDAAGFGVGPLEIEARNVARKIVSDISAS